MLCNMGFFQNDYNDVIMDGPFKSVTTLLLHAS
jgi:hypothetical protein